MNFIKKTMPLILGAWSLFPFTANASQREMKSVDSIAYVTMNHQEMLYRQKNYRPIRPTLCLRSSSLCEKACQILGRNEAFYIYTDESDDKGFVIVSADDRMPEVLAYSYDAPFCVEEMSASTKYWLECYLDDYMYLNISVLESEISYLQSVDILPEGVTPILGELPWGQSDPYNNVSSA